MIGKITTMTMLLRLCSSTQRRMMKQRIHLIVTRIRTIKKMCALINGTASIRTAPSALRSKMTLITAHAASVKLSVHLWMISSPLTKQSSRLTKQQKKLQQLWKLDQRRRLTMGRSLFITCA